MALPALQGIAVSFGGPTLLEQADLQIEKGERVCLVGRNGTGKSTLMRLIAGEITPDAGEIIRPQGVRITMLEREVPRELSGTVFELVEAYRRWGELEAVM